jgi:hypothetical protein
LQAALEARACSLQVEAVYIYDVVERTIEHIPAPPAASPYTTTARVQGMRKKH